MLSHQTLRRLVYFAAIADAGSIRGAANRLNLSVPVLSEALSALEEELGVSLAARTTRQFRLTEAGVRAHAAARRILDTAEALTDLSSPARPLIGRLSITVPVELAGFWLPARVNAFSEAHPGVVFDIDVSDSVIDLQAGPVELALRTTYVAPRGKSRSATNLPLVVVADAPVTVGADGYVDLNLIDSRLDRTLSPEARTDRQLLSLSFPRIHRVTNRSAGLALARAGGGAVLAMRGSVLLDLENGALFEVLPDYDFGSIDLHPHFRDKLPSRIAQAFVDFLGLEKN